MSKKDIKIVRLVLSISIVFFLTYTPTIVLRLMFLIQPNLVYNDIYLVIDLYRNTIDLTAKVANSGTNILFYYVLSSRYREEMKSMCKRS